MVILKKLFFLLTTLCSSRGFSSPVARAIFFILFPLLSRVITIETTCSSSRMTARLHAKDVASLIEEGHENDTNDHTPYEARDRTHYRPDVLVDFASCTGWGQSSCININGACRCVMGRERERERES